MNRFLRFLRGTLSIAAIWGGVSALVGAALAATIVLIGDGGSLLIAAGVGARVLGGIGAGLGIAFSVAVAGLNRGGQIAELSVKRMALAGAAIGAAFPFAVLAVLVAASGGANLTYVSDLLAPLSILGGMFGSLVGGMGAATIAMAKRGDRLELQSGGEPSGPTRPAEDS